MLQRRSHLAGPTIVVSGNYPQLPPTDRRCSALTDPIERKEMLGLPAFSSSFAERPKDTGTYDHWMAMLGLLTFNVVPHSGCKPGTTNSWSYCSCRGGRASKRLVEYLVWSLIDSEMCLKVLNSFFHARLSEDQHIVVPDSVGKLATPATSSKS